MIRALIKAAVFAASPLVLAADEATILNAAVADHILPGFGRAAANAERLAEVAERTCDPESAELREAFHDAWDTWIAVSHLRFGPTETEDRGFALGFWPDSRGATPKTLNTMIAAEDEIVSDPAGFSEVSIAARGYTALEFLLFDAGFSDAAQSEYGCMLIRAIARDIAANSDAIFADWSGEYGAAFKAPRPDAPYRSANEALSAVYGSMTTGLEFTIDARLGRPMGTFERPRPKRAEAWRSGRSLRHVLISVQSNAQVASILSHDAPNEAALIAERFSEAVETALDLDDPVFAGVADPSGRLRVEALQQRIAEARDAARLSIGPRLGIAEGFNALDGD